MKDKIHQELKQSGVAKRYFAAKGLDYSRDTANKMFNQDNNRNRLDESVLLKVLKQLVNEQINLIK